MVPSSYVSSAQTVIDLPTPAAAGEKGKAGHAPYVFLGPSMVCRAPQLPDNRSHPESTLLGLVPDMAFGPGPCYSDGVRRGDTGPEREPGRNRRRGGPLPHLTGSPTRARSGGDRKVSEAEGSATDSGKAPSRDGGQDRPRGRARPSQMAQATSHAATQRPQGNPRRRQAIAGEAPASSGTTHEARGRPGGPLVVPGWSPVIGFRARSVHCHM